MQTIAVGVSMTHWYRCGALALPEELRGELFLRSALASTFAATLELARRGRIELRQDRTFGPIYLRSSASVGERKEA